MKSGSKRILAYSQPSEIRTLFSLQFVLKKLVAVSEPLMILQVTTAQPVMKISKRIPTTKNGLMIF